MEARTDIVLRDGSGMVGMACPVSGSLGCGQGSETRSLGEGWSRARVLVTMGFGRESSERTEAIACRVSGCRRTLDDKDAGWD